MQKIQNFRGYFKFTNQITGDQIIDFAKELAANDKYLSLWTRKVSKDQIGLGFEYQPEDNTEESFDAYVETMSDTLKKKFGNGLAGWDLGSSYTRIK